MKITGLQQVTTTLKAIAEPMRLRILHALQQGEWCVCELVYALEVPQSTLSTHLQVLRQAGLVAIRQCGKWIYYRLHPQGVVPVDVLLTMLQSNLSMDPRIARDTARLQQCLQYRVEDCCVMGFRFAPIQNEGGDDSCGPANCCG